MKSEDFCKALLSDQDFRLHYDSRALWIRNFGSTELQDIFNWDAMNSCLSFNRITNDRFRMSTERGHEEVNRRAFRGVKDAFGRTTDYLIIHEFHKLMQEGVTAVLEAVNELSAEVAELTLTLGGLLRARSTANAYVSFGSTSGFGAHNDDHDVIVLQLHGRKRWRFFRTDGYAGKATVKHLRSVSDADHGDEIIVSAGDAMYVPKGTWHDVVALNEESLHLTISLVYPTLADFIVWGLSQDKFGLPYHDLRPGPSDRRDVLSASSEFFARLLNSANLDLYLSVTAATRTGARLRADLPRLNAASPNDAFRRTAQEVIAQARAIDEKRHETFALGRMYSLTQAEIDLLRAIPHVGSVQGHELKNTGSAWEALAPALSNLLELGLIGKVRACR